MKDFSFTLRQLKVIQTIKTEGNVKITAKHLKLSQPAVSLQLKQLQQDIYSKILIRKKNEIYFTPEGELVLDYANKVLRLCEEADKAILYLKTIKKFTLIIGSNKMLGKYLSSKIIEIFCRRYSYSHVKLKICCDKSLSWNIINGRVDIGILPDNEVPTNLYNLLHRTSYFEEQLALVIPISYEYQLTNDLTKLNLVTIKPHLQSRHFIDNILNRFNLELKQLKIRLALNSSEAIKRSVYNELGVAFLSPIYVKEEFYKKRLNSITLNLKNTNKRFTLAINIKNKGFYLSKQFYDYCFTIINRNLYNKFLNLDY
uniref:Probable RuBisCO transcriptional regulator n=1 Tax=Ectocarpus siliculosus TaxID=2880 RepID=D1J7C3_ECTSI|nr:Probable RuBisCO transcriptional regulator [Ectocarpus siliculosus]CAT18860.1 Probable RuBisCO transcriptional regulator [Ectocarpus siliculosus]CAV31307.1 Probable RuBisCO transcriptional regulator [Ectocarpus siliculosus]